MRNRRGKIVIVMLLVVMISALYTGVVNAVSEGAVIVRKGNLDNVRDYAAAFATDELNYAVDGGVLYTGTPNAWRTVPTPKDVIVGAVAIDPAHAATIYIGAANDMAIYRSINGGQDWLYIPLTSEYIGGVTDIAVNNAQRTLYVGTDTAGIFRLRDVGSSLILSGHTLLDEPVMEVVADQLGQGLAYARTLWHVYQGVNNGQSWLALDMLTTAPTALAIANGTMATVYIGTVDRGLLKSEDGFTWSVANAGLGVEPGNRLQVDALAIDPAQPNVLYVATSFLFGHSEVHQSPVGVAMSTDSGAQWSQLAAKSDAVIARLLPVSGQTGAVYALTTQSRTPLALGTASVVTNVGPQSMALVTPSSLTTWSVTLISWLIAAAAAATLAWLMLRELYGDPRQLLRAFNGPSLLR